MGFLKSNGNSSSRRWSSGRAASSRNKKKKTASNDDPNIRDSNRSLGKWFNTLSGRTKSINASFLTEATDRDHHFHPCDDDAYTPCPPKSGCYNGDESPSVAPKFLSEVASSPTSARKAAFEEFLESQDGADEWQLLAIDRAMGIPKGEAECGMLRVVPEQNNRNELDTIRSNNSRSSENMVPVPTMLKQDRSDTDKCQSGRDRHCCSRRSASLSVSHRRTVLKRSDHDHDDADGCDSTSIDIGKVQSGCERHRRSASLSISRYPSPGVAQKQWHHSNDNEATSDVDECKSRSKDRLLSYQSPLSPVFRRQSSSSSSVSTLSLLSTHESQKKQRQSRSRSRYSWMKVPSFHRSRSRKPMKPTATTAIADPQGKCPHHPFVQLRRRSTVGGEWRTLQHSCPLCVAANDSSGSILDGLWTSPNVASKQRKSRLRSRSYSISRRHCSTYADEDGGLVIGGAARPSSQATGWQQKPRLRCRSSSLPRHYPVDTDDCIDKVLSAARKENEAPLADDGPIVWVSFQTLEDGDDESASTNEMALAMIEDVQSENASLHKSMLEATELAKDMSDKLADLVQVHEVSVRDYEKQIATLEERLGRKDDDASTRLNSVKEENEILRAALIIGEEEEEGRSKSIKKKEEAHREDMERVALEREALQEEMRALRQALATLTGCGDESCRLPMEYGEGTGLVNDSFDCEG